MKTIKDDLELLGCKVGDYILLEGYGILNGLRGDRINNKKNYYKILGLSQEKDLILKKFGAKKSCILPSYNMNQNYLLFKNNLTKGKNNG